MHYTIERLLKGDHEVVEYFERADRKWSEFFDTVRNLPVSDWAKWLTHQQMLFFEHQCGGRTHGQEVMAWSGFAHLYSTQVGFEDNREHAEKLRDAFAQSMVSIEVKGMARDAAASYLE